MSEIVLSKGYVPGAIGRVAELHATYYHEHWGFGLFFEAKVAAGLSEFLQRCDERRDGFWTVRKEGKVEGSLAIDGRDAEECGAHLRWFILSGSLRGRGWGQQLLSQAIAFCRAKNYPAVYLWTFEGLHAARHLYEKNSFRLAQEQRGTQWGVEVNEQRFELHLLSGAQRRKHDA